MEQDLPKELGKRGDARSAGPADSRPPNQADKPGEEPSSFFDEETKNFYATRMKKGDMPIRKRVVILEYTEPATEAKLTLCRERLNKILDEYKSK